MPEMTLIASAFSGVKTAMDMSKALLGLHVSNEVKAAISDLRDQLIDAQNAIFQAQTEQSALVQHVRKLEEQLVRAKNWDAEKQRYELANPWDGAVVYALKESMSRGEPPHWICTSCYEDGRRSILNPHYPKNGQGMLMCTTCNGALHYGYNGNLPDPTYAPVHGTHDKLGRPPEEGPPDPPVFPD